MEGDRGVQCACRAFLWSGPTMRGGTQLTSLDSAQLVVTARVGRWCLIWLLVNVWLLMLKLVVLNVSSAVEEGAIVRQEERAQIKLG